jgi:hypothetical protein
MINLMLNTFLVIISMWLGIGSTTQGQPKNNTATLPHVHQQSQKVDQLHDVKLQIEETADDEQNIVIYMYLSSCQFSSPHLSERFSGQFTVSLQDNERLVVESQLIASPLRIEEPDIHNLDEGLATWFQVNTTHEHQLKVISQGDFEVSGLVSVDIERSGVSKEVEFVITSRSGKLTIKKG